MQVKKRDGSLQGFDREKLKGSVVAAGVADNEAESLTAGVEVWMEGAAVDGAVESQAIWEKVYGELQGLNSEAAEAYRKFRG